MTRRAVDIEALPAAVQDVARDWERKCVHQRAIQFACIQNLLRSHGQVTARNGSGNGHTGGLAILEEIRRVEWVVARLQVHVLTAPGTQQQKSGGGKPRDSPSSAAADSSECRAHRVVPHSVKPQFQTPRAWSATPEIASSFRGRTADRAA